MLEELQIRVLNLQFAATSKAALEKSSTALSMDEPAFDVFYKQTSRALLRYLVAVTRQPDIAEDVLQEAYCRLLTARHHEMDKQQARSYLFRIATNLVRDRWRRGKAGQRREDNARNGEREEREGRAGHLESIGEGSSPT